MIDIISLTQAKQHIKADLDVTDEDDALYMLLELATQNVLARCRSYCSDDDTAVAAAYAEVDAWTSDTAPAGVKAAILYEFGRMDRMRGDADEPDQRYFTLSPRAEGFLALVKDPVLR